MDKQRMGRSDNGKYSHYDSGKQCPLGVFYPTD